MPKMAKKFIITEENTDGKSSIAFYIMVFEDTKFQYYKSYPASNPGVAKWLRNSIEYLLNLGYTLESDAKLPADRFDYPRKGND